MLSCPRYVLAAGSVQDNLGGFEYETFQQGHWWGVQHMLFKKSVWHRDVRTINRFCELHYLERDDLERTLMLCPNELDGPKKRIRSLFWRQFCKFTARNAGLVREYVMLPILFRAARDEWNLQPNARQTHASIRLMHVVDFAGICNTSGACKASSFSVSRTC